MKKEEKDKMATINTDTLLNGWPMHHPQSFSNSPSHPQFINQDQLYDDSMIMTAPSMLHYSTRPNLQSQSQSQSQSHSQPHSQSQHPPISPPYLPSTSAFTSLEQTIDSLSPAPSMNNNSGSSSGSGSGSGSSGASFNILDTQPYVPMIGANSSLIQGTSNTYPSVPSNMSPASPPSSTSSSASPINKTSSVAGGPSTHSRIPPKPKFSPEDDSKLIHLKENSNLTWRQIAQHFDGRSAGALQVRYCTKLKARSNAWTEDEESALRQAISEYEEERWLIVSQKLDNRFSPNACRDKYKQMRR